MKLWPKAHALDQCIDIGPISSAAKRAMQRSDNRSYVRRYMA